MRKPKPLMAQPITPKQAREGADKERMAREESIQRSKDLYETEMNTAREKYGKSVDDRQSGEINAKQFKSQQNAIKANADAAARKAESDIATQGKMIKKAYAAADDVDKGINRVKVKDVPVAKAEKMPMPNTKPMKEVPPMKPKPSSSPKKK